MNFLTCVIEHTFENLQNKQLSKKKSKSNSKEKLHVAILD